MKINKSKGFKIHEWQIKGREGGVCNSCGKQVEKLTVDHIIPLSIVELLDRTGDMAYNWEDNFELLCVTCNRFKSSRLDIKNPKTKTLLLKLIEQI